MSLRRPCPHCLVPVGVVCDSRMDRELMVRGHHQSRRSLPTPPPAPALGRLCPICDSEPGQPCVQTPIYASWLGSFHYDRTRAFTPSYTLSPLPAGATIRQVVWNHVVSTMTLVGGNQTQAAKLLGISRSTIVRLLRDYERSCRTCGERGQTCAHTGE